MAAFVIAPALERFRKDRFCWSGPARMPSCVFAPRTIRAGFMGSTSLPPNKCAKTTAAAGKPPKSSMAGNGARFAINEVADVYWQRGAGQRPVRLIVIAPTPYRKSQSKKLYYRDPAYLLTSDR